MAVDATVTTGQLNRLAADLHVFSSDTTGHIARQELPIRFKSNIAQILVKFHSTAIITASLESVKAGVVSYIRTKISSIEGSKEQDPWIILRKHNHLMEGISDHVLDVLEASRLIATHRFSRGAVDEGDEVVELSQKMIEIYLPCFKTLPENEQKPALIEKIQSLSPLLGKMGEQLKKKEYAGVLETHQTIQKVLEQTSQIAQNWGVSRILCK